VRGPQEGNLGQLSRESRGWPDGVGRAKLALSRACGEGTINRGAVGEGTCISALTDAWSSGGAEWEMTCSEGWGKDTTFKTGSAPRLPDERHGGVNTTEGGAHTKPLWGLAKRKKKQGELTKTIKGMGGQVGGLLLCVG